MIRLQITNKDDEIIFSNLGEGDINKFKDKKNCKKEKYLRSYYKEEKEFNVWIVSEDKDLYKSNKLFNKTCKTYLPIINGLYKDYSMNLLAGIHTIVTIQAKMSQKIEPFIKGATKGKQEERIRTVKNTMKDKTPEKVAGLVCFLSKRIEELNVHLESLKIIEGSRKQKTNVEKYFLYSVLLNVYDPFKQSFNDKNIRVVFNRIDKSQELSLDYKIFNLVFHHIFDNASKYSKKNDTIHFIFSSDNKLIIQMHSLTIENSEQVFLRGVSGGNVGGLAGDGIGMFVIKKGLQVMGMNIDIKDDGVLKNSPAYSKNKFIIDCVV